MSEDGERADDADDSKEKRWHLPPSLALLTDRDRKKFLSALEVDKSPKSSTYGQSFLCVHSVVIGGGQDQEAGAETVVDLKGLFAVQLRTLCKNMGIPNSASRNKYECRRMLARLFTYQDKLETSGLKASSNAGLMTNSICRAVNVVFSEQFIESFKTVNDIKTRRDHETQNTSKTFWINAALAYNDCNDEEGDPIAGDSFSKLVIADDSDPHLQELISDPEINIMQTKQYDTDAFRKKISDLFHVRRIMKENMTASGTHDSNPWNFVEGAMNKAKKPALTKLGVYYFYVRCNEHPDMDAHFQPFLDPLLLGDTVSLNISRSSSSSSVVEEDGFGGLDTSSLSSAGGGRSSNNGADSTDRKRSAASKSVSSMTPSAASTKKKKYTKKNDAQSDREFQYVVTTMMVQSQNDFREFMTKQDAFVNTMISEADKKNARSNLHFRLEVAKAMGDVEEMRKIMEEVKNL